MKKIKLLRIITSQGFWTYEVGKDGITNIEEGGISPAGATAFRVYSGKMLCAGIETPFFEIQYVGCKS